MQGSRAVFEASGGGKTILPEEQPTIDFAYACVVTTRPLAEGETLSRDNTWVKRPGTGEIKAKDFDRVIGRTAARALGAPSELNERSASCDTPIVRVEPRRSRQAR